MCSIGETDKLDLMAKRKDGGVDLFIISTGQLEGSPEMQTAIMDKLENYFGYINSKEFRKEFGKLSKKQISVILQCEIAPDQTILELVEKIKPWAEDNNCSFSLSIKP